MIDFYKNKKVFITGCTGFKGSWLCGVLLQKGAEITGYSLAPQDGASLFIELNLSEHIALSIGDVRDREHLTKVMRDTSPGIVFHLAAQPLVRRSYREPALTYETNVIGTVNVLEALRQTASVGSFVNVTTDKVYENKEWHWGYRENENLCGADPYSNSKSCSELVTYSYRHSFFNNGDSAAISTARAGNVIGGGDYSEDRIIPDCVRAARAAQTIILRNPRSVRPYQHVLDCLSGYLLLAEKQFNDKTLAGSYNFGPGEDGGVSTERLADMFCKAWGCGASYKAQSDGGPHEDNFLKLDCSKAKAVLGWAPRWGIKTAVEKTVEYAKAATDSERRAVVKKQIGEYFG